MAFRKRSDQHPSTDEIMTEVNSNDTKRKRSRNMIASWILPNKQRIVIGVLISFVLFQIHQLLSSVRLAEIYEVSVQINNSYVDITGIEDLERRSKLIENRCYPGMEELCQCEDPTIGVGRRGQRHWLKTSTENRDSVISIKDGVDVVFYGDSITEGWKGTSYGFANGRKDNNYAVFKSQFTLDGGGKFEGIPMGISGDRSPDLLWRLINGGELPQSLSPAVYWLLIGTNDMGWAWCSPEVTLIGILRVVEELRAKKPGAFIVINGLLPRSFDSKGYLNRKNKIGIKHSTKNPPALWKDIQAINAQLEEYSNTHDNVIYFYAGDLFMIDSLASDESLQLDKNLMNDYLHPSAIGYKLWGDRIVEKLEELIKQP